MIKNLLLFVSILLTATSVSGQVKFKLRGRIFIDGGVYINAPDTLSHTAGMPDIRLGGIFTLPHDWSAKVDVRFSKNEVSVKDVFIQKKYNEHIFRLGHMFGSYSLDQTASTNDYVFMTGSYAAESFYLGRRLGLSYNYAAQRYFAAAGIFVGDKLYSPDAIPGINGTLRFVYRPILKENTILHIGTGAMFRTPDKDKKTGYTSTQLGGKANTYLTAPRALNLAFNETNSQWQWNTEVLGLMKRWLIQAEYLLTHINSRDKGKYTGNGAYIEGGYLIRGKMLEYDYADALSYCTSAPHSLLLSARFDHINLNSHEIRGGKLYDLTVALNYYLNKYLIFRLNYSHQWTDEYSQLGKTNWGLFQARAQFKF